jgi:hypothetical protein
MRNKHSNYQQKHGYQQKTQAVGDNYGWFKDFPGRAQTVVR